MWALLLGNWKLIAVGIAIIAFAIWIESMRLEIDHLKKENGELTLELATIKDKDEQLANASAAITRKYEQSLANEQHAQTLLAKATAERIRNEKILATIKLPDSAVQLFNDSTGTSNVSPTTKPVDGNDGQAGASTGTESTKPQVPSTDNQVTPAPIVNYTLQDMLLIANENNKNHWNCIKQVEDWQRFWKDFNAAVVSTQK
jgi:hypothetical protein